MTATTLKQIEAIPDAYPPVPDGLSDAAAGVDPEAIWQRLEAYLAYRWSPRKVTWVVEGPGSWLAPLQPAELLTVETWSRAGEWEEVAYIVTDPLGQMFLSQTGHWRITATVGGGEDPVPAAVQEAFRRLAEYMGAEGEAGASSESIAVGSINIATRRDPAWQAKAMQYSGAGDLLRRYRRA